MSSILIKNARLRGHEELCDLYIKDGVFAEIAPGLSYPADETIDVAGKLVSAVPSMVVPLQRGQLTTVRGKFLTSRSEGAVSIDPSFEGEFNLQIP